MIYRSGEKNLATRQSLKFNIRGEIWLQKEPASQAHKVDPRFHPTLNQRYFKLFHYCEPDWKVAHLVLRAEYYSMIKFEHNLS